jgi:hypothetical protein
MAPTLSILSWLEQPLLFSLDRLIQSIWCSLCFVWCWFPACPLFVICRYSPDGFASKLHASKAFHINRYAEVHYWENNCLVHMMCRTRWNLFYFIWRRTWLPPVWNTVLNVTSPFYSYRRPTSRILPGTPFSPKFETPAFMYSHSNSILVLIKNW